MSLHPYYLDLVYAPQPAQAGDDPPESLLSKLRFLPLTIAALLFNHGESGL